MPGADELRLDIGWGELCALAWRRPGRPHALCLHGWMDNAASFLPLAEHLRGLDLVALDFAGHGHSDHRPAGAHYYFTDYLYDVDAALDALGWDHCGLVGHSLGGGVASSLASADPERVDWLVMVDGMGTLAEPADCLPGRLQRSLASVRKPKRHRRRYTAVTDAARVRAANNPMLETSAMLLAERGLAPDGDEFRWRTDERLMWTSPAWYTERQAVALLAAIQCPTLTLTTTYLEDWMGDRLAARMDVIPDVRHDSVPGQHHVHMDDPAMVGARVLNFLQEPGVTP